MRVFSGRRGAIAAVVACLAIAVSLSGCADAESVPIDVPTQADGGFPDETGQRLQDAVAAAMTATGSTGAIVGVWAPWSGSWVDGIGTQSPTDDTPVTADLTFPVADVTRSMTCDVLYILDARKVLDADDSVTDYVGGVASLADVSLRQLCDSTSGVGSYAPLLLATWLQTPARVWGPLELASYGLGKSSDAIPGSRYLDSDAGYLLLGLALERATGTPAHDLFEQYLAGPLDLEHTLLPAAASSATDPAGMLTGLYSRKVDGGYQCAEPTDVTGMSPSIGYTDSGVVSTVDDLHRYVQALAVGSLMADGVDRYDTPYAPAADAPTWDRRAGGTVRFGSLVGQFGAVPGHSTAAFADPESGLTVVVTLNNSAAGGKMAAYLARELAAIASKAPAAGGEAAPDAGLPWTADEQHKKIAKAAICSAPED
ncbi:serine hydrolase domain-containing protein [Microbacterium terricola]|uniref:Beta-lactamase n=1 Tax=Microbacterium terricola TaxID=344163 RepID=A0ABM8E2Y9_9MICO|nr:serine hydrolase domain-containing protein [Microbacterium terricola]UYK39980.1 beta-lactamase family protein [Microbacterium terricola]BDV32333.1 beta-lactamase [Microbacterium terricola]